MSRTAGLSLAERKAWARRQGSPLWLWPEVAPDEWLRAVIEIERSCTAVLAGKSCAIESDPVALELAAYTSGMGPLLGWWLENGQLSASGTVEDKLRHQLHANGARMARLLDRTDDLAKLLARSGIDVTVLKGAQTAPGYFPSEACRPMSDIDLLVAPDDAIEGERVLKAADYRLIGRTPFESTWQHRTATREPLTMVSLEADDPWSLDLHVSLDVAGPPGTPPARLSQLGQARSCAVCRRFPEAFQLAQPALLLHLAAHAGSGFHNLTLMRLVEILLVARADSACGALDWDEFAAVGRATGSLAFAYPALHLARRLAPADIPQAVIEHCAAEAPSAIRRLLATMRPATAHRIDRPSLREHFAWTTGAGGWLRRLAADVVPQPDSLRKSAAVHAARARGLLRAASLRRATRPRP